MATTLITGTNKGIGLEFCRQLAQRGDQVIATCRQPSPELQALSVRIIEGIEMTSDESAARLARELADVRIDCFILNAGVFDSSALGELDFGRMLYEYDVNALGPLRIVQAMLPRLSAGVKIVLITSRAGSIGDNTSGRNYGYRMAKAALNMAGVSLAHDLRPNGIIVSLLHPGMVDTDLLRGGRGALGSMAQGPGVVSPEVAVRDMLERIDELTIETSGRFLHRNGEELPW